MKPKNSKINADIFLIVAEMLLVAKEYNEGPYESINDGRLTINEKELHCFKFCCDDFEVLKEKGIDCDKEFIIFDDFYNPQTHDLGWWPNRFDNGDDHDYESRIYACLFLYELYK